MQNSLQINCTRGLGLAIGLAVFTHDILLLCVVGGNLHLGPEVAKLRCTLVCVNN